MQSAETVLGVLRERGKHGLPCDELYRQLFNPQLYPGTQAQLAFSQEEIGRLSGISRQNVNRALHDLEAAGLVRVTYGAIEVLDLQGLRKYSRKAPD